ncbi:MAG: bacteriocin family protein [Actinobacteria bacterium]|nr:bacteriocin family protein [Actinomycetota bacterium]
MNHLSRELAPISSVAWDEIENEAKTRLTTYLAARKVVDFEGPHGWTHSSTDLGRTVRLPDPTERVKARQRRTLQVVELRADFALSRDELDDVARGADSVDLDPLDEASERIAIAENVAIFHGYEAGGIVGITQASPHDPIHLSADLDQWPVSVAVAVNTLLSSGIGGPYALAIGPAGWTGIVEAPGHGGRLLFDHLRQILGGPVIWAPGVEGAVVLSQRGGDFVIDCGQDLSIGYAMHDVDTVQLYFQESFTFRAVEPAAAIALTG